MVGDRLYYRFIDRHVLVKPAFRDKHRTGWYIGRKPVFPYRTLISEVISMACL